MSDTARPLESKNERAICRMMLHDLARTLKVEISDVRWVDEENRESQAIELEAQTTGPTLSFEHTRIEAYGGQIGDGQQFLDLVWKLEESPPAGLRGPLRVTFELFATRHLKASEIPGVVNELARWLLAVDSTLGSKNVETRTFGSANIRVSAERRQSGTKPLLFSRWLDPGFDVEEHRRERVARALDRKLPKLKAADGLRCLILESNDIALSSLVAVCKALEAIASRYEWLPDYIYVVETECLPWLICPFKEADQWWPKIQRLHGDSWYYGESV